MLKIADFLKKHKDTPEADLQSAFESVLQPELEAVGKDSSQKANREAKNLRDRLNTVVKLFGAESDEEMPGKIKALNTEFEDLKKFKETAEKGQTEKEKEISTLSSQVEKLTGMFEKSEKEKKNIKLQARTETVKSTLIDALNKGNVAKPAYHAKVLMQDVEFGSDDATAKEAKLKVGEDEFSLAEGVEKFIDLNKDFVKPEGSPGGNSGDDRSNGGNRDEPDDKDIESRRKSLRKTSLV